MHDILTGSQADGTAFPAGEDRTCGNWTKSGAGRGHARPADRIGPRRRRADEVLELLAPVPRGCSLDALKATGGAGLLYCFAAD